MMIAGDFMIQPHAELTFPPNFTQPSKPFVTVALAPNELL